MVPRAYNQTDGDEVTCSSLAAREAEKTGAQLLQWSLNMNQNSPRVKSESTLKDLETLLCCPVFCRFSVVLCIPLGHFFTHMFNKVIKNSVCWSWWSSWLCLTFSLVYFPVLGSFFGSEKERGMSAGGGHFLSSSWLFWWPKSNRNSSASPGKCSHGTAFLSKLSSLLIFIIC